MEKPALADHPIHQFAATRWSPRAFAPRPVAPETLRSLFEAARWAPSGGNEQPWRFVVVTQAEPAAFAALLATLEPGNQRWVQGAPVLLFAVARRVRGREGKPNGHARYDLGQAVAWLSVEATSRGLVLHQMGGFSPAAVSATAGIPEEFDVVTAVALGYPGEPEALPADLQARERAPRVRRPQTELVFGARWGEPWAPDAPATPPGD